MKVNIGQYKSWFGPYQLAEAICFWVKNVPDESGIPGKPKWVHQFGDLLAYGSISREPTVGEIYSLDDNRKKTALYKLLSWIDSFKKRKIEVRIDEWDTWSMDDTLAHIILPMLRQLRENNHGAPWVDDDDVPDNIKTSFSKPKENDWDLDDNHFKRWEWVLDEMIFAFECKIDDSGEDKFYEGNIDFAFKKLENGMSEMVHGPKHTSNIDTEGLAAYKSRIRNGFRLFGKYYESLWE